MSIRSLTDFIQEGLPVSVVSLARSPSLTGRALRPVHSVERRGLFLATTGDFNLATDTLNALSLASLPGVAGAKEPNCHLRIGVEEFADALSSQHDEVIVTWIHESVHGRHGPWTSASPAAWHHIGYEEGLAEGVAQWVAGAAGLLVGSSLYPQYVRSYEILASVLGVDVHFLFRRLWHTPHARIEDRFDQLVGGIVMAQRGQPLSPIARGKLRQAAQALFSTTRRAERPDDLSIQLQWETAL